MLTKTDCKTIDRAISDKRSPQYQQGYDAAIREIVMLSDAGMTTEQIVKVLREVETEK